VLGWLSFGEGFHNNHHQHPNSARMGERWYELDLGWLAIRACERLGLIWDVRRSDRVGFVVERTIGERALPEQRRNRSI
jgi:stearoyl-CoA desaturase (delta-9 desaturase)